MLKKKENMERLYLREMSSKYKDNWIVAVNCHYDGSGLSDVIGDVYLVTTNKDEAYSVKKQLNNENIYEEITVFEGHKTIGRIGSVY